MSVGNGGGAKYFLSGPKFPPRVGLQKLFRNPCPSSQKCLSARAGGFCKTTFQTESPVRENRLGGFQKGGSCNSRFVLQADVAIASKVAIFSKDSLAIADSLAKRTQHANYCGKPPSWNPPHSLFPTCESKEKSVYYIQLGLGSQKLGTKKVFQ